LRLAASKRVEAEPSGGPGPYYFGDAVDCGTVVNPDTVRAQIQSAIVFGITAALHGEITLKDGRVQQANFDTCCA
jgi:isoquinoline 1-oxidoreductase subunit beta